MITNCKYCNSSKLNFEATPKHIHYGKMVCGHCNRFSHWVSSPEKKINQRKNKQSVKDVCNFHQMKNEICFFCLRTREQLGFNETLTIDHIEEIDNGGKDTLQNMQVLCSACHKLKNWTRLYMNWHLNGKEKKGDDGDT